MFNDYCDVFVCVCLFDCGMGFGYVLEGLFVLLCVLMLGGGDYVVLCYVGSYVGLEVVIDVLLC